jgi:hypothetical protein
MSVSAPGAADRRPTVLALTLCPAGAPRQPWPAMPACSCTSRSGCPAGAAPEAVVIVQRVAARLDGGVPVPPPTAGATLAPGSAPGSTSGTAPGTAAAEQRAGAPSAFVGGLPGPEPSCVSPLAVCVNWSCSGYMNVPALRAAGALAAITVPVGCGASRPAGGTGTSRVAGPALRSRSACRRREVKASEPVAAGLS